MLEEIIPASVDCHFFVCGPAVSTADRLAAREKGTEPQPRFLESILADLKSLGVTREQITYESYG
jgi:Na+-transporting NADH:ubiquinone oxidoreductase subunit NqrF